LLPTPHSGQLARTNQFNKMLIERKLFVHIIIIWCFCRFVTTLSASSEELVTFTGNVYADFDGKPGTIYFDDPGNFIVNHSNSNCFTYQSEPTDVYLPAYISAPRSGWDVRTVYFRYNTTLDILQVGIRCYGVCGDADGDGNSSFTTANLALAGGQDLPNLSGTESITILIDPFHDGSTTFVPTIAVGNPGSATTQDPNGILSFNVYNFTTGSLLVSNHNSWISFGPPIAEAFVTSISDPMAYIAKNGTISVCSTNVTIQYVNGGLEFNVVNFSQIPGLAQVDGTLRFSFALYAGSAQDADIGNDFIPELAPVTSSPPPGTVLIGGNMQMKGFYVQFNCSGEVDYCGVCNGFNRTLDDCGVCGGQNKEMNNCGVCFGPPNQTCPGYIESVVPIDLAPYGVYTRGPVVVASLGDIDGNCVGDFAVGTPWDDDGGLPQRGSVHIFLMNCNGTVNIHQKIGNYTATGFPFYLEAGDLFGSSLAVLGDGTVGNESFVVLAVGAPGTNGSLGAVYTLTVDQFGNVLSTTILSYANNNQLTHLRFGSSLNTLPLSNSIVLIAGAPGPDINSTTNSSALADSFGVVYLLVYSYSYRFLGIRVVTYDMVTTALLNSNVTIFPSGVGTLFFGSQAVAIGDLDKDGVTELAITAFIFNNVSSEFDPFAVPTQSFVYIVFLNSEGSVTTITQLQPQEMIGSQVVNDPTFGTSIVGVGDLDGDSVPDLAVGSPNCLTLDKNSGLLVPTGCIYIVFLNANGTIKSMFITTEVSNNFNVQLYPYESFGASMALLPTNSTSALVNLLVSCNLGSYYYYNYNNSNVPPLEPTVYLISLNGMLPVSVPNTSVPSPSPIISPGITVFIPSSPGTSTPADIPGVNYGSPSPIVVTYLGNSPQQSISPVGSNQYVIIWFESLIEWDANGTEVNRFDIPGPGGNYTITFLNETIPQIMWTITFQGATINFVMTHFLVPQTVVVEGTVSFQIDQNTNKCTLQVFQWPFLNPQNSLEFVVRLETNTPILTTWSQLSPQERVTRYRFETQTSEVRATIAQFGVLDNSIQSITAIFNPNDGRFHFQIPYFSTMLQYDPDFTILALTQENPGVSVVGVNPIPGGLIGGIIVGTAAVLIVTAAVFIIVYKCRQHARHEKQWKAAAAE